MFQVFRQWCVCEDTDRKGTRSNEPRSRIIDHQEYRLISRRGIWGLLTLFRRYLLAVISIQSFSSLSSPLGIGGGRRETYSMSSRKRIDIQERKDFIGFEEFEGGDVAWLV